MKIAVLAANGRMGKLLVKEAHNRGHDVLSVARQAQDNVAQAHLQKDILDVTLEDLSGYEALISAFGANSPQTAGLYQEVTQHLADLARDLGAKLYVVGGAGSLYLDESKTHQLYETMEVPAFYLPVLLGARDSLEDLRSRQDVDWVYLSPAQDLMPDNPSFGTYQLAGEVYTTNQAGQSYLSYEDYAQAMIDLVEAGDQIQVRLSVYQGQVREDN